MPLLDAFSTHVRSLGLEAGRALVAVSGGPDSMALLDLLARSGPAHGLDLVVGHVDHGIDPRSAEAAAIAGRAAADRGLPFELARLSLGGAASETTARAARLAALEALRERVAADCILLAHHADDQAETVLMRVLRGSGPAGLAGIPLRRGRLVPRTPPELLELERERVQRSRHGSGRDGCERRRVDSRGKPVPVVTKINAPAFNEFWLNKIVKR